MSNFNVIALASSYILFCHVWLLTLRNLFFSNERQKGSGSLWDKGSGEKLGEEDEGETVIGDILCDEKNLFSIKGKRKKEGS